MNISKAITVIPNRVKVYFEIGWFSAETFVLLDISILESSWHNLTLGVLTVRFLKFAIGFGFTRE